ncbi:hypothetical protein LCGC14_2125130 [marine sediment metagenome]|uniref:Uncharacterized protein n=1 Tax=marine sediment metagenome TaxID=412755 RepID=A0A0F9E354_9ZZZZ
MAEQTQERVTITRLTIKIGDAIVHISKEEAKQLKEALDEIFPAQIQPVQIHWHHDPFHYTAVKYPRWEFGNKTTDGEQLNTCSATLEINQKEIS